MATVSLKSVAEKLGIKKGHRVVILGAPAGYSLGTLPPDAWVLTKRDDRADIVQLFVSSMGDLKHTLPNLKTQLNPATPVWVTYPKGTSKTKPDLNRDIIREYAATIGFETVALFAVDETWSALRLKNAGERDNGTK